MGVRRELLEDGPKYVGLIPSLALLGVTLLATVIPVGAAALHNMPFTTFAVNY